SPPPSRPPTTSNTSTAPAVAPMLEGGSRRRPLLDLFPPVADARPRPPGPMRGTASGPALPRAGTARLDIRGPIASDPHAAAEPTDSPGYETFYGLAEKPFTLSTDPNFLYHSTA